MLAIRAESLTKYYGGVAAVDGIDLSVERGRIFGFLGPNGAGKSTTIKMLTTLIPPSSGSLSILGIDARRDPLGVRRRIGVVLQQPSYETSLSVERALDTYGMMWNVPRRVRRERISTLLDEFDLQGIRRKSVDDLSIGQRRRVQVAREFIHDMDLLFLDEPTVGLDTAARRSLLDYLKAKARGGLTILYTTHVLSEAEYICDDIAIINRGHIAEISTPENLKRKFGREKTITIHVSPTDDVAPLLAGTPGCRVGRDAVTVLPPAEESLLLVLETLHSNGVHVRDLTVESISLEDIFLRVVGEQDAPAD